MKAGRKFGHIVSQQTKEKISSTRKLRKIRHSDKTKRKLSKLMKERMKNGWSISIEARKKIGDTHRGEKNPMWKGGVSAINNKIRHFLDFKLWREAVFKRDNWTCIWCGQRGGKLHPDHIKPFADFPELRFAIDNGRTLCFECHKKTDSYGWKYYHNKKQ